MDCSWPCSSVHGIIQARLLEWVSISYSYSTTGGHLIPGWGTRISHATWYTQKKKKKHQLKISWQHWINNKTSKSQDIMMRWGKRIKYKHTDFFFTFNIEGLHIKWETKMLSPISIKFSSVQSLSRVQFFETLWIAARQTSLSITNSQSSPKLKSIESVMPSSHLILCRPLLLLPPIPPSIRVFSNESTLHMRWPKYWSFSFSISPSSEHPELISLQSKGLSRVFSNTTVQKHQFFSSQLSSQSNSHIHTWPLEKITTLQNLANNS